MTDTTSAARRIGPLLATMLVAGNMIGSGVFLLPATLAAIGSSTIIGWIIASGGAMLLAGVFALLAILKPTPDGLVDYPAQGLHPFFGFANWLLYWLANWAGVPAIALAITGYLSFFIPALKEPLAGVWSTIGFIWLMTLANIIGARTVTRLGGMTLLIGLAPIIVATVLALMAFDADTDELVALVTEAGRCGGIYTSHMRSEGNRLLEAIDELIEISRRSGAPAEIYHLKAAGKANWHKIDAAIAKIEAARASGLRISADMYTYTAGSTGLDAAMPTWVQAGGREAWIKRLKDPATRREVIAEMRVDSPAFENLYRFAGAEGTLLVGFRNPKLKHLTGKTLAEVAKMRGVSPEDAAIDLVIEDGSRVQVVYFLMSEENVRKQVALPWMSFGSDAAALTPDGVFAGSSTHPRAYGNVARLLGRYVREEKALTLPDAVRRLSALPAQNLGLRDRGMLKAGNFADVVIFDPATIGDTATYETPKQFATGVRWVLVNGGVALKEGEPTALATGRVVRGRGWKGWPDGGCRASAKDWQWAW